MLEHSTQYNNWCFVNKEHDLETIKQQKISKYRKIYQKVLSKNPQADIQLFNVDDENIILNFYVSQVSQVCHSFPLKVEASAISYFKRFFLKTTLLNYDPKRYLFSCIYLAIKTEEVHLENFETLAKQIKDPYFEKFPEFEQDILKTINFDLKVYNPFTPILSLLERLREDEKMKWDLEKFNKIYNECIKAVRYCFYDYLIFEIPHGIISLATFLLTLKRNNVEWEDIPMLSGVMNIPESAKAKIDSVKNFVERYEAVGIKEEAIKAMKKLKNYQNQKPREDFARPIEKHHHPNPNQNSTPNPNPNPNLNSNANPSDQKPQAQ